VDSSVDSWGLFESTIERYPILEADELLERWHEYNSSRGTPRGESLFAELAGSTWRLAKYVLTETLKSREKTVTRAEFAELASEANVGLCEAIESYDPEKGGPLSGYVATCVERRLSGALTGDLPASWSKVRRIAGAKEQSLTATLGRKPTIDELTAEVQQHCLTWAKERLEEAGEVVSDEAAKAKLVRQGTWAATLKIEEIRSRGAALSLDQESEEGGSILDSLADAAPGEAIDVISWWLSSLPDIDQHLVTRRYNLDGRGETKFEDIAEEQQCEWPVVRSKIAVAMGRMFAPHAQFSSLSTTVLDQIRYDEETTSPVDRLVSRLR
jgi:DNA-directed RNA polymerase specialized sigma subunit